MDKNDYELMSEVNGFEIRYNRNAEIAPYRIFHPKFNGVFIVDYPTLGEAEDFCNEEDADSWAETIREG